MNKNILMFAMLIVAGLITAIPTGSAQLDAGVVLETDTPDMVPTLDDAEADGWDDLCFADEDSDGAYDSGEGVYLSVGTCDSVGVNDLRLNGADSLAP
ncbi:MAG: hypothetical protein KY455_13670, partial [Euryarchaeota archaeon]|nr:hypothetical protein [Euryarchaeota archaeon]